MSESCETCKFCRSVGEGTVNYECRRFPPQIGDERGYGYVNFPDVQLDQWCGEWKPKELKQEVAKS